MKELLTGKFWRGVKRTFNDALEGATPDSGPAKPAASADKPALPSPPLSDVPPSTPNAPASSESSAEACATMREGSD